MSLSPEEAYFELGRLIAKLADLMVGVHAGVRVLTDYAALAPEGITVNLLTGQSEQETTLDAAARNWEQRFGVHRPLIIRAAPADRLRDNLILVDSTTVWVVGAS